MSVIDDEYYYLLFKFLYSTGLRFGECCALTWNDLDFGRKTLRVNKNLTTKVVDKKYLITTPKSINSKRIIDIDDELLSLLKRQ